MALTEYGYLDLQIEDGYLEGAYLGGEILDAQGMQISMTINAQLARGMQALMIVNAQIALGQQVQMVINDQVEVGQQVLMNVLDSLKVIGQQIEMVINDDATLGQQVAMIVNAQEELGEQINMILAEQYPVGMEAELVIDDQLELSQQVQMIIDSQVVLGMQVLMNINAQTARGFQVNQILDDQANVKGMQAQLVIDDDQVKGMQALMNVNTTYPRGMQVNRSVIDQFITRGMQVKADTLRHALCDDDGYLVFPYLEDPYLVACMHAYMGMQVNMIKLTQTERGMQVQGIVDATKKTGMQVLMNVHDKLYPRGMQVQQVTVFRNGMQATMVIYNNTQLRIMAEFPSRGTAALGGNNWVASSTAAGDFLPKNLNTDIVEQVWRSNSTVSLQTLTCDTGLPQGVPIDTIAILGHNFTRSATVQVQGSNDNFATAPNITFNMLTEDENMYYISPAFPSLLGQNRYWRFIIQDPTNAKGFLQIGTILFGTSEIFSTAECFDNPLIFSYKHFKDTLPTEGFTTVANDRALKRYLRLQFSKIDYFAGNFRILNDLFKFARTSLKALVIPTPQFPSRFAVFAKLTNLPEISHTSIDETTEYIDLSTEWDESL